MFLDESAAYRCERKMLPKRCKMRRVARPGGSGRGECNDLGKVYDAYERVSSPLSTIRKLVRDVETTRRQDDSEMASRSMRKSPGAWRRSELSDLPWRAGSDLISTVYIGGRLSRLAP